VACYPERHQIISGSAENVPEVHIRQGGIVPGVAKEKNLSESFHDRSKVIGGDWFLQHHQISRQHC